MFRLTLTYLLDEILDIIPSVFSEFSECGSFRYLGPASSYGDQVSSTNIFQKQSRAELSQAGEVKSENYYTFPLRELVILEMLC